MRPELTPTTLAALQVLKNRSETSYCWETTVLYMLPCVVMPRCCARRVITLSGGGSRDIAPREEDGLHSALALSLNKFSCDNAIVAEPADEEDDRRRRRTTGGGGI